MDADKISSFYDHESKVTQVEKLQKCEGSQNANADSTPKNNAINIA